MLEKKNENKEFGLKSQIIIPIFFALTVIVTIFIIAKEDFSDGLAPFVVWTYFGVLLAYCGISIFDVCVKKERAKSEKIFILVMAILTIIASVCFVVFYKI